MVDSAAQWRWSVRQIALVAIVAHMLIAGCLCSTTLAEQRTGHYVNHSVLSQEVEIEVQTMSLTYEPSGTLEVHIRLVRPLGRLVHATIELRIGDVDGSNELGPHCYMARGGMRIEAEPGNAKPPLIKFGSRETVLGGASATKSINVARNEITMTATDQRFANLNLICAEVSTTNGRIAFFSGPFLLDGYTILDGEPQWLAGAILAFQAELVDLAYGKGGNGASGRITGSDFACKGSDGHYTCAGHAGMPDLVGHPTLTIDGIETVAVVVSPEGPETIWSHNMHATLSWRRCPRAVRFRGASSGRRCHLRVHWSGHRDLAPLFQRPGFRSKVIELITGRR